ncbi:PLIN3 protein, partial [Alcedo cyanopectus]|nr:PLIN3 protein [Ceyx cyanopectus]
SQHHLCPSWQSVMSRVANLTLVSSTYDMVSTAYASTKESHPYFRSVCDVAEKGVKTLTAAAVSGAQPLLTRLEPQISTANEYACKGLDKLEEKLPILQQPPEQVPPPLGSTVWGRAGEGMPGAGPDAGTRRPPAVSSQVVAGTRELVSSTVSGAVGMARGAVRGGVERTRSALSSGVSTVAGTRVGRLLASGVDAVLGKSEQLVEQYLPETGEEQGEQVAAGGEVAPPVRLGRRQSYFVRVGSLSAKLRHRARRHSLGELQRARHSAQRVLAQLHHVIELVRIRRRPPPRYWGGGGLSWARQWDHHTPGPPLLAGCLLGALQVEPRTLAMLRGLLHQLHGACTRLVTGARGLPSSLQEMVGQVRHGVEDVQASLSRAHTFHELSSLVLAQSRETVSRAQLSIDELLEYVGQHAPVPWLVGPFAPALVEYPEDVPVE